MKAAILSLAGAGVFCVLAARSSAVAQIAEPRSVWSGVYTIEQATRGAAVYRRECVECHLEDLTGNEEASPLAGSAFLANWDGLSVGALVDETRKSMPKKTPGKLDRQQYIDVIAFVLRENMFPAGNAELPRESEGLSQIRIRQVRDIPR